MSGIMLNFAGVSAASVPGAPTIGTATATDATTATVSFTAPASNGGSVITSYTATSSPGGVTGTLVQSGSGTITVSGLTTNTAYTFTVTATNAIGTGPASAASNSVTPVLVIGAAFGGGFFAGQISTAGNGVADFNIVVGPVSSAQSTLKWKNSNSDTTGSASAINGPQNTADMVADGDATTYPCAHFCNDLVIGGFSDWYMPAKNEQEICYFNLKPTTQLNDINTGSNTNAVPSRPSNYPDTGPPTQTSAANFQSGGAQAFDIVTYWSSTETGTTTAFYRAFNGGFGTPTGGSKNTSYKVRAIRRVAV